MSLRVLFRLFAVTAFALSSSCVHKAGFAPWPEDGWPTATPESQGLDSVTLADAVRLIRSENINIHSIFLVRNGYSVLDVVFYPYDGMRLHDVASVTKSVTATLVGQAVAEGIVPDLDTPVLGLLDRRPPGGSSQDWDDMTLENLVTMSSGLECGAPPFEEKIIVLRNSPNWIDAALELPLAVKPGTLFDYCSPNFHLLSAAMSRATGSSLAAYARDRLFGPLGIKKYYWPADPQGISVGWGNLRLHPHDMARIGYLYLRKGRWKDGQVLPEGWVKKAVTARYSTHGGQADYGYGWWLAKGRFAGAYEARGRGGQGISVWPQADIVLVTTGGGYDRDRLVEALVPAVLSNRALPENPQGLKKLAKSVAEAARGPVPGPVRAVPETAARISDKLFIMEENPLGLESFSMNFAEGVSQARLVAKVSGREYRYAVGLDGVYRFTETSPSGDPAALRGRWETPERFALDYNEVTRINRFRMDFTFTGDEVNLLFDEPTGQIKGEIKGEGGIPKGLLSS